MSSVSSELPVHEGLDVRKHTTIYKSSNWWKEVALIEGFGERTVKVYLWKHNGDSWKLRHELKVRGKDEWDDTREAIDSYIEEL
ncbi:hypothetical protein [Halorubrum laminariae]|uniref:Uncharacterized protein n=1 Tax=Halorubrum laminariae TaxID=1433523 RepID=A0ABD6C579_9EURY|nr:hypothetical protein [Halorubrum laminariae]